MGYKLPEDIQDELQKKYQNINIQDLTNDLFTMILNKAMSDGSTTIREFGKFTAFKTFSTRIQRDVVRFKFKTTISLSQKLNTDEYISTGLIVKESNPFTEKNECICQEKRENRINQSQLLQEASKKSKEATQEYLAKQKILKILE